MAKKKSKWKKRIKKALKLAAIGGAGYLASKALRKPTVALGTKAPDFVKGIKPYTPKSDIMTFPNKGVAIGVDYEASPFERSRVAPYIKGIDRSPIDRRPPSRWDTGAFDTGDMSGAGVAAKSGGRIVKTKSGVGIAKRGFGRALGRGKK